MRIWFFVLFVLSADSVLAQTGTVIDVQPELEDELRFSVRMSGENWSRASSDVTAVRTGVGLMAEKDGFVGLAELSYLSGQRSGSEINELGNPLLGLDFRLLAPSPLSVWLMTSGSFSRPGAKLAYRHDHYRTGVEFRSSRNRWFGQFGGGYRFRINEEDRKVDVGDAADGHFQLGYRLHPSWVSLLRWELLSSRGIQREGLPIARETEWTGLTPSLVYRLGGGASLSAAVTIPLTMTRGAEETEISLWDLGHSVTQPTWKTQLGVVF